MKALEKVHGKMKFKGNSTLMQKVFEIHECLNDFFMNFLKILCT